MMLVGRCRPVEHIREKMKKGGNLTMFTESPSDIRDGHEETFLYTISSHSNTYPELEASYYEVVFDIPDGLSWSGDASKLLFHSGVHTWDPTSLNFDSNTKQLIAKYPLPAPFKLPKSELALTLSGDCAAVGNQDKELSFKIYISTMSPIAVVLLYVVCRFCVMKQ